MKKELIVRLHKSFEGCAHHQDGVEFWLARELQRLLGYNTWRRFEETIDRAKIACANAGQRVDDHFADAGKMVEIGSGTARIIDDMALDRYACYLIAQNGDPRKDEIAFAMNYFAVQTRKQELIEQRIAPSSPAWCETHADVVAAIHATAEVRYISGTGIFFRGHARSCRIREDAYADQFLSLDTACLRQHAVRLRQASSRCAGSDAIQDAGCSGVR